MAIYKLTVKRENVYYVETDSEEHARQMVVSGQLDHATADDDESRSEVTIQAVDE